MSKHSVSPVSRRLTSRLLPALLCALLAVPAFADDEADTDVDMDDGIELQSGIDTETSSPIVETPNAKLPAQELTPKILYEFLLAEIAGGQGNLGLASAEYLSLAQTTRDPRIARRAAEISFYSRQFENALQAARIWVETDPESAPARQMLIGLLAVFGKTDEISVHLSKLLTQADAKAMGEELLRLTRIFEQVSDKKTAQIVINQVTQPYLKLPEAYIARAQAAHMAGDAKQALADIEQALVLRPEWENAVLFKALLLQKEPQKMREVLRQYVDTYPMQAKESRVAYARALVVEKQYDEALKYFHTALELEPQRSDLLYAVGLLSLQANDRRTAERCFKQLVLQGHAESNTLRSYLGQLAEDDKQWDEALKWYESVGKSEQYGPAQLRAARMLVRNGQLDAARDHLHKAILADETERVPLILAESQMLRDAKRPTDAYGVLNAALKNTPEQTELLYEAALTAEKLNKIDEMERHLRLLIKLKPDQAQGYNALGYSLAERNLRLDEATLLLDKALTLTPDDPFILDSKGWLLFRLGKKAEALEMLKNAYAKRPDPEIAAHIGEVLWSMDRRDEAQQVWKTAQKQNPDNEALRDIIRKFNP